jgi:nickel/cobalt exporter
LPSLSRKSCLLLLPLMLVGLLLLSCYWQGFIQSCINIQIYMHRSLVSYLLEIENGQSQGVLLLTGGAFLYGLLHAIGPGHGKFIITTYLSTRREQHSISKLIAFAGSMMQGVVAIIFVWLLSVLFNFSMGDLSRSRWYIEKASAIFIALFALLQIARALKLPYFTPRQRVIKKLTPISTPPTHHAILANHHSPSCDCGHQHIPQAQQLDANWAVRLGIIASIGIRPCSGAILILVFANVIGLFSWGMVAAMTMALGTALAIITLATLVTYMREKTLTWYAADTSASWKKASQYARLIAGLLLLLFAFTLYYAVIPISANGDFVAAGC